MRQEDQGILGANLQLVRFGCQSGRLLFQRTFRRHENVKGIKTQTHRHTHTHTRRQQRFGEKKLWPSTRFWLPASAIVSLWCAPSLSVSGSLGLSLFLWLCFSLSASLSLSLSLCLCFSLSLSLSACVSLSLSLPVFLSLSLSPTSLSLSLSLSLCLPFALPPSNLTHLLARLLLLSLDLS